MALAKSSGDLAYGELLSEHHSCFKLPLIWFMRGIFEEWVNKLLELLNLIVEALVLKLTG